MTSSGRDGSRARVFFVHPTRSPFIDSDLDILRRHYDVRVLDVGSYKRSVKNTLIVGYRLLRGVLWADVSFSWFADRHAKAAVRLSRFLGKPSLVVVGGYEVGSIQELGYGSLLDPKKKKTVLYILRNATLLLAVSKVIQEKIGSVAKPNRVELVYEGVDTSLFTPGPEKGQFVLTVATITKDTVRLKGLDAFIRAAAALPDTRFVLVGSSPDGSVEQLKADAPKNVEFVGHVPNERLREMYAKAKVYCQLSMFESFGVALVESMSCMCVPVVTSLGALPEVVGDAGFIVPYGDSEATVKAIREALATEDGWRARERVEKMFSIEIRERELVRLLDEMVV